MGKQFGHEQLTHCLQRKMDILTDLLRKLDTQERLIYKGHRKGLRRVLHEQELLLHALSGVEQELSVLPTGQLTEALPQLCGRIHELQQSFLLRSQAVVQQAVTERNRIAAELRKSKAKRQVQKTYVNPWANAVQGRFINARG